jgi:UDP-N-acetylglucosamine--N-acetylmuramyl-(pentapeptide) pyrophosphoryl-undecaprenol N-acetylglucosamine transferase
MRLYAGGLRLVEQPSKRLLIAASGTGGHLFPAIATAEQLSNYHIEWLGVPDRLETQLVPKQYRLHTVPLTGFQKRFSPANVLTLVRLFQAIAQVRQLLRQGQFQAVFTTGGYIAAPAIIAARTMNIPAILHESNALPGKVTRWLSPWCTMVAVGFEAAIPYLPRTQSVCVGTPVRSQFREVASPLKIPGFAIPDEAPLIVVVGGSQGALAVNRLVRESASAWLEAGAWIVHLTGQSDPDIDQFQHPHYCALPFYDDMAPLLSRANLAISRAGAGTLTELAITGTPSILIPYPFAAEDHQTFNAAVFAAAGSAQVCQQSELNRELLQTKVLKLLHSTEQLHQMSVATEKLAIADSAEQLAQLIEKMIERTT